MLSVILYFSLNPGEGRTPIKLVDGRTIYIRTDLYAGTDEEALDAAEPADDESLCNTHEL